MPSAEFWYAIHIYLDEHPADVMCSVKVLASAPAWGAQQVAQASGNERVARSAGQVREFIEETEPKLGRRVRCAMSRKVGGVGR